MRNASFGRRCCSLLCGLCFAGIACSPIHFDNNNISNGSGRPATQLTGEEILQAFANVRDDAVVQDKVGTRAVNYWYADGKFISRWSNERGAGDVSGSWRVQNGLRCTTVRTGIPGRMVEESCGAILRSGSNFISLNADGSIHGVHTLSRIPE